LDFGFWILVTGLALSALGLAAWALGLGTESKIQNLKSKIFLASVYAGLAAYLVLFYCTPLPTVKELTGHTCRRFEYFAYLLLPEQLLEGWCGKPADFALADRLPVLAVAGVVLAMGLSAGWLLLRAVRADRGLTRLETFVFSLAVGLNVLATCVLLAGLAGLLRFAVMAVPGLLTVAVALGLWLRAAGRVSRTGRVGQARASEHPLTHAGASAAAAALTHPTPPTSSQRHPAGCGSGWPRPSWR
jgi:hypothetical protein